MKQRNLNALAVGFFLRLQSERGKENGGEIPALRVLLDGSYTHKKVLRK